MPNTEDPLDPYDRRFGESFIRPKLIYRIENIISSDICTASCKSPRFRPEGEHEKNLYQLSTLRIRTGNIRILARIKENVQFECSLYVTKNVNASSVTERRSAPCWKIGTRAKFVRLQLSLSNFVLQLNCELYVVSSWKQSWADVEPAEIWCLIVATLGCWQAILLRQAPRYPFRHWFKD